MNEGYLYWLVIFGWFLYKFMVHLLVGLAAAHGLAGPSLLRHVACVLVVTGEVRAAFELRHNLLPTIQS